MQLWHQHYRFVLNDLAPHRNWGGSSKFNSKDVFERRILNSPPHLSPGQFSNHFIPRSLPMFELGTEKVDGASDSREVRHGGGGMVPNPLLT